MLNNSKLNDDSKLEDSQFNFMHSFVSECQGDFRWDVASLLNRLLEAPIPAAGFKVKCEKIKKNKELPREENENYDLQLLAILKYEIDRNVTRFAGCPLDHIEEIESYCKTLTEAQKVKFNEHMNKIKKLQE